MSIILDRQLREKMAHDMESFPISFFRDELASLPDRAGPLHWHPEFEIASAMSGDVEFRVGQRRIMLNKGDGIFVNSNMLHSIRQLSGEAPDPVPNIVFYGSLIAAETSLVHAQYIRSIQECDALPYVVFRSDCAEHAQVLQLIEEVYRCLQEKEPYYEISVQRGLIGVFEYILRNFDALPKYNETRVHSHAQIRVQQMLAYIYAHYAEDIRLEDIAKAACISRSEAGRCFHSYTGHSPIEALIRHRLHIAGSMMENTDRSVQEICLACGFHSVNYFYRQYRRHYGSSPGDKRAAGK